MIGQRCGLVNGKTTTHPVASTVPAHEFRLMDRVRSFPLFDE